MVNLQLMSYCNSNDTSSVLLSVPVYGKIGDEMIGESGWHR
jgi:hypothetical protein